MQDDEDTVGFFDGDSGEIEAQLRRYLNSRNHATDKRQRQILTLRIRELKTALFKYVPRTLNENHKVLVQHDEGALFDGEIGRIEGCIRSAMKRRSTVHSKHGKDSLQREIGALVELLKSPLLHAHAGTVIDTRRIWDLVRGQNISGLSLLDPVLINSLRDPTTGQSALHRAALFNNTSLIDMLVTEKRCHVNAMCLAGQTPLHSAIQMENVDSAKRLIDLNADVSIQDESGKTPLSNASRFLVSQFLRASEPELDHALSPNIWEIPVSELECSQVIGEGATATVLAGHYKQCEVAVKEFASSVSKSEFNREVQILMKLRHPNLVLFVGTTTKDKLRLVTELCLGGSLFQLLHEDRHIRAPLSVRQILDACIDTLAGLVYLHSNRPQIIHFDLKSRNLLLSVPVRDTHSRLRVKIADFGISRVCSASAGSHRSSPSPVGGTWWWMSPETLFGDVDEICEKSDIFSFGVCLFELLANQLPYESVPGLDMLPPVAIAIKVANGFRPDPALVKTSVRDAIPEAIDLMERCWSYEPADRPSASDLLDAFNGLRISCSS